MPDKPKGPPPPPSDRAIASHSGIPLQSFLAEAVAKAFDGRRNPWQVECEEVPAGDGFIDMLLSAHLETDGAKRMAVEVKKFILPRENRRMRMLFLAPRVPKRFTNATMVLPYVDRRMGTNLVAHPLRAGEFRAFDLRCNIAEHCTFEDRGRNETIDDIARELLARMQSLAHEGQGWGRCTFVPVIVTNAELRLLTIEDVDLGSGVMTTGEADGAVVPWVCYEKALAQTGVDEIETTVKTDLAKWAAARLRTVFVVSAVHLLEFLTLAGTLKSPWEMGRG